MDCVAVGRASVIFDHAPLTIEQRNPLCRKKGEDGTQWPRAVGNEKPRGPEKEKG